MSRCIVCNKQISKKAYFCEECLKEQVGEPPKSTRTHLLSWLLLLPFSVIVKDFFTPWTGKDEEPHKWVARKAHVLTTTFPQITPAQAINGICSIAGFSSTRIRERSLQAFREIEFERISTTKKGIERAPWDVVFQPSIQILIIAVGLLGLFLLISIF